MVVQLYVLLMFPASCVQLATSVNSFKFVCVVSEGLAGKRFPKFARILSDVFLQLFPTSQFLPNKSFKLEQTQKPTLQKTTRN